MTSVIHSTTGARAARTACRPPSVAVVGAGIAGSACAARLRAAGWPVTLFDKSRGVGGRMATRRARLAVAGGASADVEFDHGAPAFGALGDDFRTLLGRHGAEGVIAAWQPKVYARFPGVAATECHVGLPAMPALCRRLTAGLLMKLSHRVQRLEAVDGGWRLHACGPEDDSAEKPFGPFGHVVLAMPPAQAAALLHGPRPGWASVLQAVRMDPCWALMAVTDDVDWPWDVAEPERGPLALVLRNDRKPGRQAPAGCATWVAQASAAWSTAHLEEPAEEVARALQAALGALLPARPAWRWHHAQAHRWRYAMPSLADGTRHPAWWDAVSALGVCGDFLAGGGVEGAWRSGHDLAGAILANARADTLAAVQARTSAR